MCDALHAVSVCVKKFPAPDRAIDAVSGAIPRDAQILAFDAVLRGAGGDVRLVVLDVDQREAGSFRPLRGGIIRMEIAGDRLRLEAIESAEIGDGALERSARLERIEIADMLAEEDVLADGDRHCVLQMPADREYRGQIAGYANPQRGVSASPAEHTRTSARKAYDRIVAGANDGAVVHQEVIGDVFQARSGFVVRDGNGLVTPIAAGSNQRERALAHQEMVQGRVRQHD